MPDFQDWYAWAVNANSPDDHSDPATWERVAKNARFRPCYGDTADVDGFQGALGNRFPQTKSDFERICRDYQLTGQRVNGEVPSFLTRCIEKEALKKAVEYSVGDREESGSFDFSGLTQGTVGPTLDEITEEQWMPLSRFEPTDTRGLDIHLAHPESNRVFAALSSDDDIPPEDDHEPGFWSKICGNEQEGNAADQAVRRLALSRLSEEGDESERKTDAVERILMYYSRESFDRFLFPVPPDAEFWFLFRPVDPDEHDFGRTCPAGGNPCNEDLAEDELVHENSRLPYDDVWVISLGKTRL